MMRIAVCCIDTSIRTRLRKALERYAREAEVGNVEVGTFLYASAFAQVLARLRKGFVDYALFCIDDEDLVGQDDYPKQALDTVRAIHAAYPDLSIGLVSAQEDEVMEAYRLNAGFLWLGGDYEDFERMVREPFERIASKKGSYISVRSASGVSNVLLEDIQFVESSKRSPVIHLPEGQTVTTRGTLQQLFDALSSWRGPDGDKDSGYGDRFVKAGSSFIVNLDNVRSVGEGSFIFADGEAVIVPIRKRKELKDAWHAYRAG